MVLVLIICILGIVAGMFAAVSEYRRQIRIGRKRWLARAEMISSIFLFTGFLGTLGAGAIWGLNNGY